MYVSVLYMAKKPKSSLLFQLEPNEKKTQPIYRRLVFCFVYWLFGNKRNCFKNHYYYYHYKKIPLLHTVKEEYSWLYNQTDITLTAK